MHHSHAQYQHRLMEELAIVPLVSPLGRVVSLFAIPVIPSQGLVVAARVSLLLLAVLTTVPPTVLHVPQHMVNSVTAQCGCFPAAHVPHNATLAMS